MTVFIEAIASVGTFAVVMAILSISIDRLELPAYGVAPRRQPDSPGPSHTDVAPSSVALGECDGPGPITPGKGGDA